MAKTGVPSWGARKKEIAGAAARLRLKGGEWHHQS
jgi:hypothetical protein